MTAPITDHLEQLDSDSIHLVQQALASLEIPLNADGVAGPETRTALVEFQQRRDLNAHGRLDGQTVLELGNAAGGFLRKHGAKWLEIAKRTGAADVPDAADMGAEVPAAMKGDEPLPVAKVAKSSVAQTGVDGPPGAVSPGGVVLEQLGLVRGNPLYLQHATGAARALLRTGLQKGASDWGDHWLIGEAVAEALGGPSSQGAIDGDGGRVLVALEKALVLLDFATGRPSEPRDLMQHTGDIEALSLLPDDTLLLARHARVEAHRLGAETRSVHHEFRWLSDDFRFARVICSRHSPLFALAREDGRIDVVRFELKESFEQSVLTLVFSCETGFGAPHFMEFSVDGALIAGDGAQIALWDSDGTPRGKVPCEAGQWATLHPNQQVLLLYTPFDRERPEQRARLTLWDLRLRRAEVLADEVGTGPACWNAEGGAVVSAQSDARGNTLVSRLVLPRSMYDAQPASYAPFRNDAPANIFDPQGATPDALGMRADVDALCHALISRRVSAPLSVGLFGDWGSGKSSFITALKWRIEELTENIQRLAQERPEAAQPFHAKVVQIDFNAWHYAEANLWASLVNGIFEGVAKALAAPEDQAARQEAIARTHAALVDTLHRNQRIYRTTLMQRDRAVRDSQRLEAEVDRRARLAAALDLIDSSELADLLKSLKLEPGAVEHWTKTLQKLRGGWGQTVRATQLLRHRWGAFALAVAALVVVGGSAFGMAQGMMDMSEQHARLAGVGASLVSAVTGAVAWLRPQLSRLQTQWQTARPLLDALPELLERYDGDLEKLREDRPAQQTALRVAQRELEAARKRFGEAQAALSALESGHALYEFADHRAQDYRRELGILSQIRDDFEQLSRILEDQQALGELTAERMQQAERERGGDRHAPPATRIILYIDDLDRCPPRRVVEVLEAIHLLLATPLFVVVTAADARWLLNCLRYHYKDLLTTSGDGLQNEIDEGEVFPVRPSHYLEKIFQVPYVVPRMSKAGYGKLLGSLVDVAEAEPGAAAGSGVEAKQGAPVTGHRAHERRGKKETERHGQPGGERGAYAVETLTLPRSAHLSQPVWSDLQHQQAERALQLSADELEFMGRLRPLLWTPRNVKSFTNTYLMLRVLQAVDLDTYLAQKRYRGALLLLALQIGHRDIFAALFRRLQVEGTESVVQRLQAAVEEVCGKPASEQLVDREHDDWRRLKQLALEIELPEPMDCARYAKTAALVRRFSFGLSVRL
ncbi:MAG: P-loop NTPase fold protein [Myxococcales bacterium]|nr:P-loop NTPase fold protein [Myxococcales bacterium]